MAHEKGYVVALVCLYGLFSSKGNNYKRSEIEMKGYRDEYLPGVAGGVKKYDIRTVILSGGITNEDYPEMSEAQSVKPEFKKMLLAQKTNPSIYLEKKSTSTPENINLSWDMIGQIISCHDLVIFCDKVRVIKVWFILIRDFWKEILMGRIHFRVVGIKRTDTHPNSKWWKQLAAGIRYLIFHK